MRLILILIVLTVSEGLYAQGQTRTKKQVVRNYYANGHIKSIVETRTTLPKYIDPMNFYKKTKVIVVEFDSLTSAKTREYTRVTKIGKDGKPCYEIRWEEIKYNGNGERTSYTLNRCDKQRSVFKQYKNGKVEFIRKYKPRKRR